jgi:glycosyltransferase involved in cell wall biosynthesis
MCKLKILHLPTSTGGNSYGLSRAERLIGLESDVLSINKNYFDYPADIQVILSKNKVKNYFKLIDVFRKINDKYDVYHFNFGSSLINVSWLNIYSLDLPFYNNNAKLVVTYNGCDCRQKFKILDKYNYSSCANPECYGGMCYSRKIDKIKERRIDKMLRYCDNVFYLNPDLKQFLSNDAIFLPYTIASWNCIVRRPRKFGYPLKIVHAPTQRGAKGTDDIINAIGKIKNKFPGRIEFILVEKMSNLEAIKIYEQADILIDQILIGWYGALSVEAMKAGCPVVVYIRDEDLQYIPPNMHADIRKTFINCNKDNLYENIIELVNNPSLLKRYSNYSYEYVNTWHSPDYVASLTKKVYAG